MKINSLNLHQYSIYQVMLITDLLYNIKYSRSKTKPRLSHLPIVKIMLKFKIKTLFLLRPCCFFYQSSLDPQRKDSVQNNNNSKHILFFILPSQPFKTKAKSWQNKSKSFQKTPVSSKNCRFYYLERDLMLYFKDSAYVLQQHECVAH